MAVQYLEHKGFRILQTNWRFKRAEVDIIAQIDDLIVFVEVKTRSSDYFGPPDAFVTTRKQKLVTTASHAYIEKLEYEGAIRFDIIAILINDQASPQISHYEDAFFMGL
ncbi:UNVERIFIED_CONTAM: hypothetical protein GTU68_043616 [Idotea baltica]|nr:hypothetical protein [Idotea baltica]